MKIEIDKRLSDDIVAYCKMNGLNKSEFISKLLKKAFTVEKYGDKPPFSNISSEKKNKPKDDNIQNDESRHGNAIEQAVLHKIVNAEEMTEKKCMFENETEEKVSENNKKRRLL